jgi:putative ABC transport system permease protein
VMRQGLALAGAGVALGLIAATGLTSQATSLLYNVSSTDPLSYALVALFLLLTAVVASWIPARRAMRVDPIEALRAD